MTYTDSIKSLTHWWTAKLYRVYATKDIALQNLLMVNVCWKTKSHKLVPLKSCGPEN